MDNGRADGYASPQRSLEPYTGPLDDGRIPEFTRTIEALIATWPPHTGPLDNGRPPGTVPVLVVAADSATASAPAAFAVAGAPAGLRLSPVLPNPAVHRATLHFSVAAAGPATVAVYDLLGRRIRVVFDGPVAAGVPQTVHDDLSGVAAGTYVAALDASGRRVSRTFQVVR